MELMLREHQMQVIEALRDGFRKGHRTQLLYAPTGFGKCLGKGTPVMMADGTIKPVEDIVQGEEVMSPQGRPRKVDGVTRGVSQLYRVTPAKGDAYVVNDEHILSLRMTQSGEIVNIKVTDYIAKSKTFKHTAKGWRADAIPFQEQELEVDPYILGAWLGDGTTKEPSISNIDKEVVQAIKDYADSIGGRVSVWEGDGCPTYRICGGGFLEAMRAIGVMGHKRIPHKYKTASIEQRRQLLAGIIDTDGYLAPNTYDMVFKQKELAEDVCYIARSLGLAAYMSETVKCIKSTGFSGTYYRLCISGDTDMIPCRVPRRKAQPRKQKKNVLNVGISVEEIGIGEYYGFSIEGDDKLFLLGDFTVTHNTEVAIYLMKATREKYKRAAMVLDRLVLVDQTSLRLSKYKLPHGVYQSGHWKYDLSERLQVCSAQTLERRSDFPNIDLLIVDECFVSGTKISTPSGPKDIDNVRLGDIVQTLTGVGVVEAISTKPANELYRLEFDDGTVTTCTGNHPYLTTNGWCKAGELEVGAYFYSVKGMRLLWERVETLDKKGRGREDCFLHGREVMEYAKHMLSILLEETSEPNEQPPESNEDEGKAQGNQSQTYQARRQRAIAALGATGAFTRVGGGVGGGSGCAHENETAWNWLSHMLQNRHSKPTDDGGNRGRRRKSYNAKEASAGQEEIRISYFPRLVNISRIERKSPVPVFNLQVSGYPSYFADGKLVHNCHIARKQTIEFIKANPDVMVVGLTATPFTKGLGDVYKNVVCGATNEWLVHNKWLTPLKVFIAKEIDMTGAKKVAGEWAQDVVTERGMKITGDIVEEWVKKTHEIYGKPEKTIVFCAGVAHGADLVEQFARKGYNFVSISYKDNDDFKRQAIEDFAKPDTEIHGLIATDILTRGFDVPDVKIGVSARPFSKSLSSHVQQMGRIMRPHASKESCTWLDHSGNFLRFRDDWDELYEDGVQELDKKVEKAKKEPTEKEKKDSKCPACGHLWPRGTDTCPSCGHVRQRRSQVEAVAGELEELATQGKAKKDDKQAFYSELIYYATQRGYNPHWASHKYREKFGVWPRGLSEIPVPTSLATSKWIKSRNIAWAKTQNRVRMTA